MVSPANSVKFLAAVRDVDGTVLPVVEHDAGGHAARVAQDQRRRKLVRIIGFARTTRATPTPERT